MFLDKYLKRGCFIRLLTLFEYRREVIDNEWVAYACVAFKKPVDLRSLINSRMIINSNVLNIYRFVNFKNSSYLTRDRMFLENNYFVIFGNAVEINESNKCRLIR